MTALADLHRAFQARILTHEPGIESQLLGSTRPDFDARLGAYVGGYRSRLVEALGTTYRALRATLGAAEFERRMHAYIDAHPSRHYSVRYYGAAVADLMGLPESGDAAPVLADLARWEWLLAEVFDAPDDVPLAADALAAVPPDAWGEVSFRFRASLRRFESRSNALEFWRASNELAAAPALPCTTPPVSWVLWRRGVATFFRSVDSTERLALDAAVAGESFGAICERLAACVDAEQVALRAASLLRGWLAEELIAGLRLPGEA